MELNRPPSFYMDGSGSYVPVCMGKERKKENEGYRFKNKDDEF